MLITWQDFIAGWVAGILFFLLALLTTTLRFKGVVGLVVGHPMDTIKVRQQTGNKSFSQTVMSMYKYEGIRGFYKGMLFPALTAGAQNAIFFGAYGNVLRELLGTEDLQIDLTGSNWWGPVYCAGAAAGLVSVTLTCPVELVKIKLQLWKHGPGSSDHRLHTPWNVLKSMYAKNGIRAFYQGGVPTILRDATTCGIYTWSYAYLDQKFREYNIEPVWRHLIGGALAGTLSWIPAAPFDVVKTRIQADCMNECKYNGTLDCFRKSYKEEGLKTFGKGFWMLTLRGLPVNAAIFVSYEYTLDLLYSVNKKK